MSGELSLKPSASDEQWARAMVICQHPAGYCGQDGFCHYGDCFKPKRGVMEKLNEINRRLDKLEVLEQKRAGLND